MLHGDNTKSYRLAFGNHSISKFEVLEKQRKGWVS